MSLEIAINENTAAVKMLIEALTNAGMSKQSAVGSVVHAAVEQAHEDAKKPGAEAKAAAATATSQSGAAQKTTAQEASAPANDLSYDDIKTPFLQLIKDKGRDAAAALLKPFSATKLPDVKPEDFAAVLDAIKAAQGEEALA